MEAVQLWAGVAFTACGGDTEGLLNDAAGAGLHLARVAAQPGGFCGHCAAWRYRPLAALARRRRVRLRVKRRQGLFFRLRPLLRRTGLWVGLGLFLPLLVWSRGLVWAVEYEGMTPGQQARAAALLRESAGLMPGARADLIGIDNNRIYLTVYGQIANTILESVNAGDVRDSICGGRILMKDYEILTLDEEKIRREACAYRDQERTAVS